MYRSIIKSLTVSPAMVSSVASVFKSALLSRPDSCGLKLLDSCFSYPTGQENGEVLALDFGGTNLRIILVRLNGNRTYDLLKEQIINLNENRSGINLTAASSSGEQLFDYIAYEIGEFAGGNMDYLLGHCFSFPFRQLSPKSAILLEWTKEIRTRMVVDREINNMLTVALQKRGLDRIKPTAIVNDAVATLLAAAYRSQSADLGSICGTGHNTSFFDKSGHLINIESGNFFNNVLPVNQYDVLLDDNSTNSLHQRFEKMVSGAYLGELFRLIILDMVRCGHIFAESVDVVDSLSNRNALDSKNISVLLQKGDFIIRTRSHTINAREKIMLKNLAIAMVVRAARLIAATYAGIIDYIDPNQLGNHIIAIDGSLYEQMPYFAQTINDTLHEAFGHKRGIFEIQFEKDTSGVGAAIAAIMAKENLHRNYPPHFR